MHVSGGCEAGNRVLRSRIPLSLEFVCAVSDVSFALDLEGLHSMLLLILV